METPAAVYTPSPRKWTGDLCPPNYSDEYESRIIDKKGYAYWRGARFFTSEMLWGESIGIKEKDQMHEVYFGPILIGRIDPVAGYKKV